MTGICVIWDRESNRLETATMDALVNFNLNRFLDDEPGRILLAWGMTEESARRFVRAYSALLAKRSLKAMAQEAAR